MVYGEEERLPQCGAVFNVLRWVCACLVTVQTRTESSSKPGGKLTCTPVELINSSVQAAVMKLECLAVRMPLPTQTTVVSEKMHTG